MTDKEIKEIDDLRNKLEAMDFEYYVPNECLQEALDLYHEYLRKQHRNKKNKPQLVELKIDGEVKQFKYYDLGLALIRTWEISYHGLESGWQLLKKDRDSLQQRCDVLEAKLRQYDHVIMAEKIKNHESVL